LDQEEEAPSDLEVWGVQKTHYFFPDLQLFLDNGGSLIVEPSTPAKGKGKATKVVEGGKKDVKRKAKDEESQKKKQKKSDGQVKKKL